VVKANRNPKLPLSVAWQHYWTTLFSEGTEWRADLEHEIKKRLYYPGKSHSFMSVAAQNLDHPKKLEELEIHIQGTVVTVSLQRNEVGPFPLFLNQNRLAISNWANGNPLEKSADRPDRVQENRRDFINAVVQECGQSVQNHLLALLLASKSPIFEIYARPNDDIFSDEIRLPNNGLSEVCRIDVGGDVLQDRLGLPLCRSVSIKKRTPVATKAGGHGSLREQDAPVVKEMKTLLDKGEEPNVTQAANRVLKKAVRQGSAKDSSVVRRLIDRFSETYPNHKIR